MRRAHYLEPLFCALFVIVFYFPLLRPGHLLPGGDVVNLFWPGKTYLQDTLLGAGIIPLWNPFSFLGAPFVASIQHAVYYPPDWIVYALFPASAGLHVSLLLHLAATSVGFWFFLRVALGMGGIPSTLMGAVFPCVGWYWGQLEHVNQIAAAAWMPWMAAVTWMFCRGAFCGYTYIYLYGAMATMQFFAGHPQEAFYTHLLCAGIFLHGLFENVDRPAYLRRVVPVGAMAVALFLILSAVQWLPALQLRELSKRPFDPPSYPLTVSMPPAALVLHLMPNWWGSWCDGFREGAPEGVVTAEYGPYVGVPILALALLALFVCRPRRKEVGFMLAVVVLATLLALGGNTDPRRILSLDFSEFPSAGWSLYDLFLRLLPPAKGFRVPARILILSSFALCTMAAMSIQAITTQASPRWRTSSLIAVGLLVAVSLIVPARLARFHGVTEIPSLSQQFDARVYRLTIGDDERLLRERTRYPMSESGASILERAQVLQPNLNLLTGTRLVDGYEEGLLPTARTADFLARFNRNFRQARPDTTLLAILGVEYVLSDLPVDPSVYTRHDADTWPGWGLYRLPAVLGDAFAFDEMAGIDPGIFDAALGDTNHQPFERANVAVAIPPFSGLPAEPGFTVSCATPNDMSIVRDGVTPGDAVAVLGAFPGWEFEDGSPVEFLNAVHARLPDNPGGRWQLAFRPRSHAVGLYLTAFGFFCLAAILGRTIRRRRERVLTGEGPQP